MGIRLDRAAAAAVSAAKLVEDINNLIALSRRITAVRREQAKQRNPALRSRKSLRVMTEIIKTAP